MGPASLHGLVTKLEGKPFLPLMRLLAQMRQVPMSVLPMQMQYHFSTSTSHSALPGQHASTETHRPTALPASHGALSRDAFSPSKPAAPVVSPGHPFRQAC